MTTYGEIKTAFDSLDLKDVPVIAHASLNSFGEVEGGAQMVVQAFIDSFAAVIMPAHTYKTMIVPLAGPDHNAMDYGVPDPLNPNPEFFTPRMPADVLMGVIPETLRQRSGAKRSNHPILSFTGFNADEILATQTLKEPLAPIQALAEENGWVVLAGVDQTVNTSMHLAERLAGRRQFTRWALVRDTLTRPVSLKIAGRNFASAAVNERVMECPGFPGCSAGFQAIARDVQPFTRRAQAGNSIVQAVPLAALFHTVISKINQDPKALLCFDPSCARCNTVRMLVEKG
jgi:aminoglycoside 3-N-acetyltransferase